MKSSSHSNPSARSTFLRFVLLSLALVMVLVPSASACYNRNLIAVPWWPNQAWGCDPAIVDHTGGVHDGWSWCNTYGDPCYGNPGCFLAETMISTPDGDRPIERLRAGDTIWCVGEDGKLVADKIPKTIRQISHGYYRLNGSTLVTGDHRFLTTTSGQNFVYSVASTNYEKHALGEWTPLKDLALGQKLRTIDGGLEIIETIEFVGGGVRVFNLEVAPHHNSFANGILVHNKKPGLQGSDSPFENKSEEGTDPCRGHVSSPHF